MVGRGRTETDTTTGFLATSIEGVLAEHFRRVISEKTRDALAHLRDQGRRTSRWAPYGFRFDSDGATLIPDTDEQAVAGRMVALREAGMSFRAIAVELAATGTLARSGKPFAASAVMRTVANRTVCNATSPRGRLEW